MWIKAPNISAIHGFSTREGGVSSGNFTSLNLGGSEDERENILQNRRIALRALDLTEETLCTLKQIHSSTVRKAQKGHIEGDALVSNKKGDTIAVSIADCYPILYHDPVAKIIGAAHAGWRGTCAKIASNVVEEMCLLGSEPRNIRVAIGQGISQKNFEVGDEVLEKFREAGFPSGLWKGKYLDLAACNQFVLEEKKVLPQNIWKMGRCTFENDFFSYRRDGGKTGRMWGLISL
jgi:YfiH family protein